MEYPIEFIQSVRHTIKAICSCVPSNAVLMKYQLPCLHEIFCPERFIADIPGMCNLQKLSVSLKGFPGLPQLSKIKSCFIYGYQLFEISRQKIFFCVYNIHGGNATLAPQPKRVVACGRLFNKCRVLHYLVCVNRWVPGRDVTLKGIFLNPRERRRRFNEGFRPTIPEQDYSWFPEFSAVIHVMQINTVLSVINKQTRSSYYTFKLSKVCGDYSIAYFQNKSAKSQSTILAQA
ncbi:hypothetical protein RF11_12166 [Thelohanellus kitauei]|uniref:Uncharacterized protein n=1 Tax=Thelohanellus kitauei TaxID=669202 RepID=A0A0C2MMU4_THEKT|nr:hypothetical protein RF11_12166 [Thelohanellus kitauei]